MKLTPYAWPRACGVPVPHVNDIVLERRGITADTAVRLSRFFGITPEFWMNAQSFYEVQIAKKKLSRELGRIKLHEQANRSSARRTTSFPPRAR